MDRFGTAVANAAHGVLRAWRGGREHISNRSWAAGKSVGKGGPMAIVNRTGRILVVSAVTAAVIGLTAGPALAATWTVSPGGAVTAVSGTTTLIDTQTLMGVSCGPSTAKGSVAKGTGLSGAGIGKITSLTFTHCRDNTVTLTASAFPWHLNAVSYNSGTMVTTGTITGIHITLTSGTCNAVFDGTAPGAHNGMVNVTYRNSTGQLHVLKPGGLHVYSVTPNGCDGFFNGNFVTLGATFTVTPKQAITSP
jgi:hypothetical protein